MAHQQPLHAVADHGQRRRDLGVARYRRRPKRQRGPGRFREHPVQHQRVKVQVHVQPAAGALHDGDAASVSTPARAVATWAACSAEDLRKEELAKEVTLGRSILEALNRARAYGIEGNRE